jgi:hypothetical protein
MRLGLATAAVLLMVLAPAAEARPVDKLDARLKQLAAGTHVRAAAGRPSVQPAGGPVVDGKVQVDVYVRGAMRDGAAALRDEGMRVEAVSGRSPQRMVEGWVPVSRLDDIAALGSARAVVAVQEPIYNTGSANSEGDAAHRAPQVRAQGFTGAGIPVGVMSDSIDKRGSGVAGSKATNDLPATVQILDEPASGTDEGRAMAQIVYDEAPGIPKIVFARGGGGAAVRAANIDALVAAGARVIADDVVYLSEPFFQDGIIAQAADRAKANGTAYFVSAGNRARQAWEGTFTPSASNPAENDFDPGAGEDRRQTITTIPASQKLSIFVQWGEPFGAVTDDFALDFYDASTLAFIGTSDDNDLASGIPGEAVTLTAGGTPLNVAMVIRRVAGSGAPRLRWVANGSHTGALPAEHSVNAQAIDPDAASARGALAVAAVKHDEPGNDTPESFSSRGPSVSRLFSPAGAPLPSPDVRAKPDIAGADGVATTTDFDVGTPDLNPFFGTSAAAPSAAGVGALLLSAKPSLSVDQLYAILRDPRGATNCTAAGFPDADCGFGFIRADGKLAMVLDSSPPSVTAAPSPGAPDGANGWYHSAVGLTWNVADADSPVATTSGCDPQSITGEGAVAFTCTASSAGGATSQPVTIKRDSVPPSAPVFSGIAPGATVLISAVPPESAIGCSASDATSGLSSCTFDGYNALPGSHTLTATATDVSGLKSTSTLNYSVVLPPFGAKGLKLARRQTIRSVLRSGLKVTVDVAADRTAIDATLKSGRTTVGRLRKTFKLGKATLKVKLNKAGKRKLRRARKATLKLTVKASGPSVRSRTLTATAKLKR